MLDKMPDDVKKTMELQDALAETANGAPAQRTSESCNKEQYPENGRVKNSPIRLPWNM